MRSVLVLSVLLLPQAAFADCVYTGAKRAYISCIYDSVLTVASDLLGLSDAVAEVQSEVESRSFDVIVLEDTVVELDEQFSLLSLAHGSRLDGLESMVDALDVTIDIIGDNILELDETFMVSFSAQETRIGALESGLAELAADLGDAQSEIGSLQTSLADHESRLQAEETAGLRSAWIGGNTGVVSIAQQHGEPFLSGITKLGAGAYRVSVAPGAFTSAPHCFCAPFHYGGHSNMICNLSQVNTTTIDILATDVAGTLQDRDVWLFCLQP